MRDSYQDQLDQIGADLVDMSDEVAVAVRSATIALLESDLRSAEQVIDNDVALDARRVDIEHRAFSLLALQAPVAGDLRTLVATLRMVSDLERMGDLAAHVAKIARMRNPGSAVPERLRPNFVRAGAIAEQMVITAGRTLRDRDADAARGLRTSNAEMDDLRRDQFRIVLADDWEYGIEAAIDVALLGRYYERIADHASSLARRVIYIVTGDQPLRAGEPVV